MDILNISPKVALAFGLRWRPLDPYLSKHKQITEWRGEGYRSCATYKLSGGTYVGMLQYEVKKGEPTNYSAAAIAAAHPRLRGTSALVLIEVPNDQTPVVAVIGLVNGEVVRDQLARPGEVAGIRAAFAKQVPGNFVVWGLAYDIDDVEQRLTLEDLVGKGPSAGSKLQPLRSSRVPVIVGTVFALGAVAGLGVYAWQGYQEQLRKTELMALAQQNTPEVQYRKSVAALLAQPVVPLAESIILMRDAIRDLPTHHEGFELSKVTCDVASDACTVLWKRTEKVGATVDDFRNTAQPGWDAVGPSGQTDVVMQIKVVFPKVKPDRSKWPRYDAWVERNVARWQFLAPGGWKADIGARSLQAAPPGLTPQQINMLSNTPDAVFAAPLTVNLQAWWYADADPDSPIQVDLLGPNTVVQGPMEVSIVGKDVSFTVNGLSYVLP